jgi:flagellar basal body-associated protein FliL
MKIPFLLALMLSFQLAFAAEGGAASDYVRFEPFVVNLKDNAYVSFSPELKVAHVQDLEYVKACAPLVRHELIKLMLGQAPATVQSPTFIEQFAETARKAANKAMGSDYVKAVFFTAWVVQ